MTRKHSARPIRILRRVILISLIAFVLAVVALYWFGRSGQVKEQERPRAVVATTAEEEDVVLVGKEWSHDVMDGERRVLSLHAKKLVSDREENYSLQQVDIEVEREDGDVFHVASELGRFDYQAERASLTGAVRLTGPHELILMAEGLELKRRGRLAVSSSSVDFRYRAGLSGRADRLSVDFDTDRFLLAGEVLIERPANETRKSAATLRSQRVAFRQEEHRIRADGDVLVRRGRDQLRARRLSLFLTEDDRDITAIVAEWDVVGVLDGVDVGADDERTAAAEPPEERAEVHFGGAQVALEFNVESGSPARGQLSADEGDLVWLERREGTDERVTRLEAPQIETAFVAGNLHTVAASSPVSLTENQGDEKRTITALRAVAEFADKDGAVMVTFDGDVEVSAADIRGGGDQAGFQFARQGGWLKGDPAWMETGRGRFEAPSIVQSDRSSQIKADGGVRAVLREELPLVSRKQAPTAEDVPIQVIADSAMWEEESSTFLFAGTVRVWQGDSLLLADEVSGRPNEDRLSARGNVRTLWSESSVGQTMEPIEISGQTMDYDGVARTISYGGGARAHQAGWTLWCADITGSFDEADAVQQLECSGSARIQDSVGGKTVEGERALYAPNDRTVTVWGDPVIAVDRDGSRVEGDVLVYDLESRSTQVRLEPRPEDVAPAADTETAAGSEE